MNSELLKKLPMPDELERTEIMNLLLSEEYGFLPEPPVGVTADVESEDRGFCAGKAVLKKRKIFFAYYFSAIAGKPFDARHTDFDNESKNEGG